MKAVATAENLRMFISVVMQNIQNNAQLWCATEKNQN